MIIRDERPSDIDAVAEVTRLAFENHPISRNTEHFIINALRAAGALSISLVAEAGSEVVGHIAFSPVTFTNGSDGWYGLGPISVLPRLQRRGIGSQLINEGLGRLKVMGAKGCTLVGDPNYYTRFGFTSPEGLSHEGVPQENFMTLSFCGTTPTGLVNFHEAFAATE